MLSDRRIRELASKPLDLCVEGVDLRDVVLVAEATDGIGGGLVEGPQAVVTRGVGRRAAIPRGRGRASVAKFRDAADLLERGARRVGADEARGDDQRAYRGGAGEARHARQARRAARALVKRRALVQEGTRGVVIGRHDTAVHRDGVDALSRRDERSVASVDADGTPRFWSGLLSAPTDRGASDTPLLRRLRERLWPSTDGLERDCRW